MFHTCGVYSFRWIRYWRKLDTDLDGFKTHAKITVGAYEVHSGGLALIFISCQYLVHLEFMVPIGTHFAGKLNIDSDGFKNPAKMSKAPYEVHSGGWHSFSFRDLISYPRSLRHPLEVVMVQKCNTKSDWFEMHPKISLEFGTNVYLVPIFRTCGVYSSRWNPLCRKVNTELGRLKTRAKMSKGAYDAHSGCLSLIFIWCQYFVRMEFIMPVGTNFGGIFNTGSDGFEMNPEIS